MSQDSEKSYLVVVNYEDDAERKRAEYILNNWDGGNISPVQGLSRQVTGVEIDDLYEQIVSKVSEDRVEVYELEPTDAQAKRRTERFEFTFETDRERVEWAMEAIMNKRKRVTEDEGENVYGIYTKKGRATISYTITEIPDGRIQLTGEISGYGEAPEFLREYITEELDYMI